MTHSYVRHDSSRCGTWLIYVWVKTHSYVRHESLVHHGPCHARHDAFWDNKLAGLVRIFFLSLSLFLSLLWDTSHPNMRHESFVCQTWLIHTWDMTCSCDRRDMPWTTRRIHMQDMSHSCATYDSFRTNSCLESSGCRTRPLKISGYQPWPSPMGTIEKSTLVLS